MAVEEETEVRDKGDTQANKGRMATIASGKCRAQPQALLVDGISAPARASETIARRKAAASPYLGFGSEL
jgi:hypothetical protein